MATLAIAIAVVITPNAMFCIVEAVFPDPMELVGFGTEVVIKLLPLMALES